MLSIKVNEDFTVVGRLAQVKEAIKEFKATYTAGDLLREFNEQTGEDIGNEVIAVEGEAFHEYDGTPRFVFNMVTTWLGISIYRVRFYCDSSLTINLDPILLDIERFDKVRKDEEA